VPGDVRVRRGPGRSVRLVLVAGRASGGERSAADRAKMNSRVAVDFATMGPLNFVKATGTQARSIATEIADGL
jgi:hypothetical protein